MADAACTVPIACGSADQLCSAGSNRSRFIDPSSWGSLMKHTVLNVSRLLAMVIAGMLTIGQAAAEKPSSAGQSKAKKNQNSGKSGKGNSAHRAGDSPSRVKEQSKYKTGEYFGDRHRTVANQYYVEQFRKGHCPPGLAKKNNGCMPPGQAKKWTVGRPLPRDVVYHTVPQALVIQLDRPSAGYRYVRVASDILLIAIGTGMIIDAIQDLGRM
jgi:Ni/Co efflux regulator RcnB